VAREAILLEDVVRACSIVVRGVKARQTYKQDARRKASDGGPAGEHRQTPPGCKRLLNILFGLVTIVNLVVISFRDKRVI
jgi:hypothetical protein